MVRALDLKKNKTAKSNYKYNGLNAMLWAQAAVAPSLGTPTLQSSRLDVGVAHITTESVQLGFRIHL